MKETMLSSLALFMGLSVNKNTPINGIAADSRKVRPGDLFFALPGEQTDGHLHLASAAANGAVAAVVIDTYDGPSHGLILLPSNDVLKALHTLAKNYLKTKNVQVIGITGSIGKTTTKDFVYQLLKQKFRVSASPGNSNSKIGLPLTILNHLEEDDELLILEMAMDNPGQITQLIDIAPPSVALITTVGLVHVCYFNSIEEIAKAKAEIFSHPMTKTAFYHLESDYGGFLSHEGTCRKFSFSTKSEYADLTLFEGNIKSPFESGILAPLAVSGVHNNHNLLAAVTLSQYLGMSLSEINQAIPLLKLPERRFQVMELNGITFVNDAYNASELSVKAALDSLPMPKGNGKRIAILSDMRELGKFSEACHRSVAQYALNRVDALFCYGEESRHLLSVWEEAKRPVTWTASRSEMVSALRNQIHPSDVVLLKGSLSMQVWKILEELDLQTKGT